MEYSSAPGGVAALVSRRTPHTGSQFRLNEPLSVVFRGETTRTPNSGWAVPGTTAPVCHDPGRCRSGPVCMMSGASLEGRRRAFAILVCERMSNGGLVTRSTARPAARLAAARLRPAVHTAHIGGVCPVSDRPADQDRKRCVTAAGVCWTVVSQAYFGARIGFPRGKDRGSAWCLWARRSATGWPTGTSPAGVFPGQGFPGLGVRSGPGPVAGTETEAACEAMAARLPQRRWLAHGVPAACQPDDHTRLPRQMCRTVARQVARQPRWAGAPAAPGGGEAAGQACTCGV